MGGTSVDPQTGQQRDPPVAYTQAEELFNVKPVPMTATSIDNDVDELVIVHPKMLCPATQFAIDQYAMRGGRILMFVDPVAEVDNAGADPSNPLSQMHPNEVIWGDVSRWSADQEVIWGDHLTNPEGQEVIWGDSRKMEGEEVIWGDSIVADQ